MQHWTQTTCYSELILFGKVIIKVKESLGTNPLLDLLVHARSHELQRRRDEGRRTHEVDAFQPLRVRSVREVDAAPHRARCCGHARG
jgi:hypothetical protein